LRLVRLVAVTTLTVLLVGLFPSCLATNYESSYWLLDHSGGSNRLRLTVSVTSSLYEYYHNKDHNLVLYDFAKFVTPSALRPVANSLWSVYGDDEDFVNGVLMLVHQIPYKESAPQKYPVEIVVENEGDCDLLSFVAASIMKAGGLDVVLLYYETQKHMNVGINLAHIPNDARTTVYYFNHNGKRYYVAECTGGNWENGWRVGEGPDKYNGISARVITLENAEKSSPGQVSSSYSALTPSSLGLVLSSIYIIERGPVTMSGLISPAHPNTIVTIYIRTDSSVWNVLERVTSDSNGYYSYTLRLDSADTYYLRASWSGDIDHTGADSDTQTLTVLPVFWLLAWIVGIGLVSLATLIVAMSKRSKTHQGDTDSFTQLSDSTLH